MSRVTERRKRRGRERDRKRKKKRELEERERAADDAKIRKVSSGDEDTSGQMAGSNFESSVPTFFALEAPSSRPTPSNPYADPEDDHVGTFGPAVGLVAADAIMSSSLSSAMSPPLRNLAASLQGSTSTSSRHQSQQRSPSRSASTPYVPYSHHSHASADLSRDNWPSKQNRPDDRVDSPSDGRLWQKSLHLQPINLYLKRKPGT